MSEEKKDGITIKCVDCGKDFTLTQSNIEWYNEKGFQMPKRCEICLKNKKQRNKDASSKTIVSKNC